MTIGSVLFYISILLLLRIIYFFRKPNIIIAPSLTLKRKEWEWPGQDDKLFTFSCECFLLKNVETLHVIAYSSFSFLKHFNLHSIIMLPI